MRNSDNRYRAALLWILNNLYLILETGGGTSIAIDNRNGMSSDVQGIG